MNNRWVALVLSLLVGACGGTVGSQQDAAISANGDSGARDVGALDAGVDAVPDGASLLDAVGMTSDCALSDIEASTDPDVVTPPQTFDGEACIVSLDGGPPTCFYANPCVCPAADSGLACVRSPVCPSSELVGCCVETSCGFKGAACHYDGEPVAAITQACLQGNGLGVAGLSFAWQTTLP
jgi:hypothetical protein